MTDVLVSGVRQSHLESDFRALVLFSQACDGQLEDPFAIEADVGQTARNTEPFFHIPGDGSLHLLHSCQWDLIDSEWPH